MSAGGEFREVCTKVFACDLSAFDALAVLRSEALPHSHLTLQPSPLEVWSSGLQQSSCTPRCLSDLLDMSTEPRKRARAVLSSIPRCGFIFCTAPCYFRNVPNAW
jgi:hypothetical protein